MSRWKECKLSDLGEIVGGGTPSTKNESYYGGHIAWITPKDLSTLRGRFISRGERNITIEGLKNSAARLLPPNSILFTSRAPIGYVAIAKNEVCTNQGFKSIVPNENADYLFLYYLLVYNRKRIENMGSGTTFKEVSGSVMKEITVSVPTDIEEQRAIARILGSLYDKIENNNAINQRLEQIAQSIFKSWFVDFEPFGGEMPSDWQEGTISDLGEVVGGSTPSKGKSEYYTHQGIAWITPKDLSVQNRKFISCGAIDITEHGLRNSSAKLMPRGTVLFSSRAPIGYIAIASNELCTNQGFKSIVPKKSVGTAYVYYFLLENLQTIENMASGSTFKEVSGSTMKTIPAIIPDENTLRRFQEICNGIFEMQEQLETENTQLAEIRDTLLPLLMSGELSVADLEDIT